MFEQLTDRFQQVFRKLTGRGILTEANIEEAMRDVRRALLEADVNYEVAREFVASVREQCLGREVLRSVSPGQQAVKIVHDELVRFLGESEAPLNLDGQPSVIMLVGLHGSGKTTTAAKLARLLRDREGRRPLLVACDLQRPAAIDQLEILGEEIGIPVYVDREARDPVRVAVAGSRAAAERNRDVVILDTAGRHEIAEDLVQELASMKKRVHPDEVLLVADAALGQESVSVARHFHDVLGLTGVILTKLDGDARGGAAVSIRKVTGCPIKFVGVGEKVGDLEPFFPDRMASRILGMGDVVSLVEKAAEQIDEEEAARLEERMRKQQFGFDDFLDQLRKLRRMGGLMKMLDLLPGMGGLRNIQEQVDEKDLRRVEGIVCSMTPEERRNPELLRDMSRRRRIARGSGVDVNEVSQLIKRFEMMREMMSRMMSGEMGFPLPGLGGGLGGGLGLPGMPGGRMGGRSGPPRMKPVRRKKAGDPARKKKKKKRKKR